MKSCVQTIRESLGFRVEEVALMARWSPARQRAIEAGEELSAEDADVLTTLLGVPEDALLDRDAARQPPPLGALLRAQADTLDAATRFQLTEAVAVAREIQALRAGLGEPTGLGRVAEFAADGDYRHPREGGPEALATLVRRRLDLGDDPIPSLSGLLGTVLGASLLWTRLPVDLDALSFAREDLGAVVVLNTQGAHTASAYGRRVTLAHELCHLLFDRPEMPRFLRACRIERGPVGAQRSRFDQIERRARAFALYLLAPRHELLSCWARSEGRPVSQRVHAVMCRFGIGYEAARAHLENLRCLSLRVAVERVPTAPGPDWEASEPAPAHVEVSSLRAGELAALAERAVQAGHISRRRAAELRRGPLAPPAAWMPHDMDGRGYPAGLEPS